MKQSSARDPSTLASLHPAQAKEHHYRSFHNSVRMHGSHYMALRRPSRVPESGREYMPGDPVNLIDWKAYARTDQLIIREVRDEASSRILIGIDVSETMQWPDRDVLIAAGSQVPTKAEIALRVGFNLAHLHLKMGDIVELWLFTGAGKLPMLRAKPRSASDVVSVFERIRAGGFSVEEMKTDFSDQAFQEKSSDVAIFVGDGLGDADFTQFLASGNRAYMWHLLSSLETDLSWTQDATSYFDEGVNKREYQGNVLKHGDGYSRQLRDWMGRIDKKLKQQGAVRFAISDRTGIAVYMDMLQECQ